MAPKRAKKKPQLEEEEENLEVAATPGKTPAKQKKGPLDKYEPQGEEDVEPVVEWWNAYYAKDKEKAKAVAEAKALYNSDDAEQRVEGHRALLQLKTESVQDPRKLRKWDSLEWCGMLFTPGYIPHKVPLVYDGEEIVLPPFAEEIATYFANIMDGNFEDKDIFVNNFWAAFKNSLEEEQELNEKLQDFDKCEFRKIKDYLDEKKAEKKKPENAEEATRLRHEKKDLTESKSYCLINTVREKLGNVWAEPAQLFRGRGKHPFQGCLKMQLIPENVRINVGVDAPVPRHNLPGHAWGQIETQPFVGWLASFEDNVTGQGKHVALHANSSLKGKPDLLKYEKARKLSEPAQGERFQTRSRNTVHFNVLVFIVRQDIMRKLKSALDKTTDRKTTQIACIAYMIDRHALRVGGEKDAESQAETVGATTLQVRHVHFHEDEDGETGGVKGHRVSLKFLGKDSIEYNETHFVQRVFWEALRSCTIGADGTPKGPRQRLFEKCDTKDVNEYFQNFMPGLSAKVFRTYNASITLEEELSKMSTEDGIATSIPEKTQFYENANKAVAILCNHQRNVNEASFAKVLAKIDEKSDKFKAQIEALKEYGRLQQRKRRLEVAAKEGRKKKRQRVEEPDGNSEEQDQRIPDDPAEVQRELDGMDERLAEAEENIKAAGMKSWKATHAMKIKEQIDTLRGKVAAVRAERKKKEDLKNVALNTSKVNYMDPRITVAFCKRVQLPLEHVFSKTLRNKFPWAMFVDSNWRFGEVNHLAKEEVKNRADALAARRSGALPPTSPAVPVENGTRTVENGTPAVVANGSP